MLSGIYKIFNTITKQCYVGSSKNIIKRWKRHLYQLSKGSHHSIFLQRSWNKYGKTCFTLEILEKVTQDKLFDREAAWINLLKPEFNLGTIGGGDNLSNHPLKNIIRLKISSSFNNKIKTMSSTERKAKFSRPGASNPNWKGGISKPFCKTCNKPISYKHVRCNKCSKIGSNNSFYGKKHSNESKNKISKSKIGKKPANSKRIIIDGIIYLSQSDAAKSLGISPALVTYRIKKGIYTVTEPISNFG